MRTSLVFKNILNVQPMARFVGIMICILFLLVGFVPAAFSFGNGQAASLVIGQSSFTTGANALTQAGLSQPLGVTFDSGGNLWVMDSLNHRVLEYVPPFSNGMSASHVIGQSILTTSTAAATRTGLRMPEGVEFDSVGDLWVTDELNNRTLEYVPPFADGMQANLVIGEPDFTTTTGGISQNSLTDPHTLAFASGNLWVVDGANNQPQTGTVSSNRLLGYLSPFSDGMPASLVIGQSSFTTNYGATTQSGLNLPVGVAVDSQGNLWVSDGGNNTVLEF